MFNKNKIALNERKIIMRHLKKTLPDYLYFYDKDGFDFCECDEEIFMHITSLLANKIVEYGKSPWINGKSVIFNNDLELILKQIIDNSKDNSVKDYCISTLEVLKIIKKYAIREVSICKRAK